MAALELKLFYLINKTCANPIFDKLTPILTLLGEYDLSLIFAVILFILLRKEKKIAAGVLFIGLLISGFAVFILKNIFPRQTPFIVLQHVRQLVEEPDTIHSFPSGHAACVFLTAVVLSSYFGRAYLFFSIAIAASFVRVYSGVHYVSDVIAGIILGIVIGYSIMYTVCRIKKFHSICG